jgi:acyl-CoA hydrolase/GNAT superfamily N-acetyltransferase
MISPAEAVSHVKNGDRVYIGSNCGEPQTLVQALFDRREELSGVDIVHLLTAGIAPYAGQEHLEHFRHQALFIGHNVRQAASEGAVDYIPVFLSEIPRLFRNGQLPLDVAMVSVTPPDSHGFCSLGISVDIGLAACRTANVVIAEVQPEMPRTHGESFLHVSEIDVMVESGHPLLELKNEEPDATARGIARHIADLIEDASTLQMGIGAIPNAVLELIGDKNDLGIHTEMFSDGIVAALKRGNITCLRKTHRPGKVVASFCMGTRLLYDTVDNNPFFEFRPSEYVNDPFVVAQNERMVAINSAIEVDLTGQICSDSIGHQFFSGFGGQVDFIRGASRSKFGKPIIALPSTARNGTVSRIVSTLRPGAGVVTSRADVHYVITEYGVAYLHGKPVRERVLSLIRIAHPDFRDQLLAEAKDLGYIPREQPALATRYPDELVKRLTLAGGEEVVIRPILPTDETGLKDHFYALGHESIYRRFGSQIKNLARATLRDLVNVDYKQHMALLLLAQEGEGELVVASGRYYVNQTTNYAEFALAVRDDWQGRGAGKALFDQLVEAARLAKLRGLEAWVQAENARMMNLLMESGLKVETRLQDNQVHVLIPLAKEGAAQPFGEDGKAEPEQG